MVTQVISAHKAKHAKHRPVSAALPPDSLAYALQLAAQCVQAVAAGTSLSEVLTQIAARQQLTSAQRGAMQDLAFYTLRRFGLARTLADALLHRDADAPVAALLQVALALLADTEAPKYPAHTVVDQAVQAAQAMPDGARIKGFVNGVLRTFLRGRDAHLRAALKEPVARWNVPAWWLARLQAAYPQQWQDIVLAAQQAPPLTLRANVRVNTATQLVEKCAAQGIAARATGVDAVVVDPPKPVPSLPGFSEGAFSVQDAGAQLAAPLLGVRDGMRVLDACAAPGGKTAHLLEQANCTVLAVDSETSRLPRVHENLQRLRLVAQVQQGDATQPAAWWDGVQFDAILLDAPCSASGIVRRHPDIAWLRRDADIAKLASLQRSMLDALWSTLKVGGRLLYVTCSIFPEEGEAQASAFVQRKPDAKRLKAPGQLLPTATQRDNHDGFFYALFEKNT